MHENVACGGNDNTGRVDAVGTSGKLILAMFPTDRLTA